MSPFRSLFAAILFTLGLSLAATALAEDWPQFKFDARHSGNASQREIKTPLGLIGTVATGDAIYTSPVVADGRIFVVDGSGTAICIVADTLKVLWQRPTDGGAANCNNVSSPAVVGKYLHFGTTAGNYYVLDRETGDVVRRIRCDGPIFSTPVTDGKRAYFVTLGAQVYALKADGTEAWNWDFVKHVYEFDGDRWNGTAWLKHKQGRVNWKDHFVAQRNLALFGKTVIVPAGGRVVFLDDAGAQPKLRAIGEIPAFAGREYPAAFGLSVGEEGEAYVQWHRRDNAGRVEVLRLADDNQVTATSVPGTETAIYLDGLLSFCSVSIRGKNVFRCRPEQGYGFCLHQPDAEKPKYLGGYPSICPPVLAGDQGVYGGLDGKLYVVPLSGKGEPWTFATAFGSPISAPVAIADGRVYVGCEDGYLYVLGSGGKARLPAKDLQLTKIRTPLSGKLAGPEYDWYTNYGNFQSTNANDQGIKPPLKIKWIRRYDGTFKHLPVCGGGRMYTHTSEGQIFAVEQETGRQLWRAYFPGVYLSFTSPLYYREKLLVPQAGMHTSKLRCLDAATGKLLWEVPFTGSPSWSRQFPPVVHGNLAIYASGSGDYAAQGSEKPFIFKGDPAKTPNGKEVMSWIYTHNNPYYPKNNKPHIWAWDLDTGKLVWKKDFSEYGSGGNDCGICILDGKLYYSTFFGYSNAARQRRGMPSGPNGITAALDPATGEELWLTDKYSVTAGCTISARDGRLYLGGYNQPDESVKERFVYCLDAKDGSLVWKSDPVRSAVNVITVTDDFVFSNASGGDGHVFDKASGKIVSRFNQGYACTRFTVSGSLVMGSNMDLIDLADGNKLISTGPCVDSRECVGSTVSNGRIFYTSQASGIQVSQAYGEEAQRTKSPWEE